MSIIQCPECKKDVSDTVETCPHCGYRIIPEKRQKINRKLIFLIVVAAIVVVFFVFAFPQILENNENSNTYKEAMALYEDENYSDALELFKSIETYSDSSEKIEEINNQLLLAYEDKYTNTAAQILILGDLGYYRCTLISSTWSDAIDDKYDDDFNDNIMLLLETWEASGSTQVTDDILSEIKLNMKDLQNPPSEWSDAYDQLIELYSIANTIYEQSTSPTGSLLTFNSSIKEYYSDFEAIYNTIIVISPEIETLYEDELESITI